MVMPAWAIASEYVPRDRDCILLAYEDPKRPCFSLDLLPDAVRKAAAPHAERGGSWVIFAGKLGRAFVRARTTRLDAESSTIAAEARRMVSRALADAKKEGSKRVVVVLGQAAVWLAPAVQEGGLLGGYSFDRYLKKKASPARVLIVCPAGELAAARRTLATRMTICECVNAARDVQSEPPNVKKPASLAREFQRLGGASGLRVSVWDAARLGRERCGGILGVGQGSRHKPCMVIAEYRPARARKHLCLVGKGVTFDSGGYGLKPADSQVGMKYDMGGAAMVFAAACAIARLRIPIRLTVIAPLVENAISGDAYHTTSILRSRSGRTIEVQHTDAEGRIILADALTVAAERKPDWIFDAATLTGACVVALGEDIAGVYGTDPDFTRLAVESGAEEGELFWELPLHAPYEEQLKSTVADCKNVGSRWGGSITAALFLKAWVQKGAKWIHCDIAGPASKEEPLGFLGKGAKGFGVKTLVALAGKLALRP
jgi:leucyl aminopeptidase